MGIPSKPLSRAQFMNYFGKLQQLLIDCKAPEDGYFLTEVVIRDVPGRSEIEVTFAVEYGPIANYDGGGDVNAEMLECRFTYVFDKSGNFKTYKGAEPAGNMDFRPSHVYLPAFEDFPDPEDDEAELFEIIGCIISRCMKCGKPLHTIQFCTTSPEWSYDFYPGTPSRGWDGGEAARFEGDADGLSLTNEMQDDFTYCYTLQPSKEVSSEYDLIFWVKST